MLFPLRKSLFVAIAFAMLALLTLSACGGGDDDDDSGDNGGNDPTATEDSGDGGDDDADDEEETATEDSGDDGGDDDDGDDGGGDDGGDGFHQDLEIEAVACSLLSHDLIQAETGIDTGTPESSSFSEGFGGCNYSDEDFNTVIVGIVQGDAGDALFDLDLGGEREDVDGVGDRAHYLPGILPTLEFLKDDWYVSISVNSTELDDDARKEAAIELGKIAADELD